MRNFFYLLSVLLLINTTTQSQIITTIAGNGTSGSSGAGELAINAQLNNPRAIAFDNDGNLLIADGENGLRQVDSKTGIITTILPESNIIAIAVDSHNDIYYASGPRSLQVVKIDQTNHKVDAYAGNFSVGSSGDGGPAVDAQLYDVVDLAFDKDDNLYILEGGAGNRDVRKVDYKSGIITTVAGNGENHSYGDGGLGTDAALKDPLGIAFNSKGNLLITEGGSFSIRKLDLQTGLISSLPFRTSYYITRLILDKLDNIYYISLTYIRKVDNITHEDIPVAGNSDTGFNGDNIAATTAALYYPSDIAFDNNGNLAIADRWNNRIRSVSNVAISLPVTLSEFTASSSLNKNKLIWQTGVESLSNGFNIEKSNDGITFRKIGYQPAKGSNSSYEFIDQRPDKNSYYRLQLLNLDGSYEYSKVVKVIMVGAPSKIAVMPNPAKNKITVRHTTGIIQIYNSIGQLVLSKSSNGVSTKVNISSLANGVYTLKDTTGVYVRFIKQ